MKIMYPSTELLLQSFKKLNADISSVNYTNNSFIVAGQDKKFYIRGIRTPLNNFSASILCNDKERCKELFIEYKIPTAPSEIINIDEDITSNLEIIKNFIEINGKTVLKPVYGLKSQGIEMIDTFESDKLTEIINNYREVGVYKIIMLEKFIPGDIYRILFINSVPYCALKREPFFIIGDGENTIEELVLIRNQKFKSIIRNVKPIDLESQIVHDHLASQGYQLSSILKINEKVHLFPDLKNTETVTNMTSMINHRNLNEITRLIKDFDMKLIGLDVIAKEDNLDNLTILEINKSPALDFHHYPDFGESSNPSDRIAECILGIDRKIYSII